MALLCFCAPTQAAIIIPKIIAIPDIVALLGEPPVEEEFLKALRRFGEWNENLNNPDFYYKRVTFRDRAGKIRKFKIVDV